MTLFFLSFIVFTLLMLMILITVPFITLMEQKLLSAMQIRLGPNYVSFSGLLQSFADATKLFLKESSNPNLTTTSVFFMSPVVILTLSLIMWTTLPLYFNPMKFKFSLLFFICVSSLTVYPILAMGWASNSKYSILGSIRTTAQMISYEVSLMMILLSLVWLSQSMNMKIIMTSQLFLYNLFILSPVSLIWLTSIMAETNRTPFDFSEGESELVSGFNTEYSAEGFTLIFIAEYASILFMSMLFCILFITNSSSFTLMIKTLFLVFLIVWLRATLPRFRYDKLMLLAWKVLLPVSIFLFLVYFSLSIL